MITAAEIKGPNEMGYWKAIQRGWREGRGDRPLMTPLAWRGISIIFGVLASLLGIACLWHGYPLWTVVSLLYSVAWLTALKGTDFLTTK